MIYIYIYIYNIYMGVVQITDWLIVYIPAFMYDIYMYMHCVCYIQWMERCMYTDKICCMFFMCTVQISVFALCSIPMAFQCMHAHGQGMYACIHIYIYTYTIHIYIYNSHACMCTCVYV